MKKTIAVLPGDGIGPEVIEQAVKVLKTTADKFRLSFKFVFGVIGGEAVDKYGSALPDETLKIIKKADAVLLGAVGGPKWDDLPVERRPEQGLLKLRIILDVYANLRPIRVHPSLVGQSIVKENIVRGTDFIITRELTGGIYFGEHRRISPRLVLAGVQGPALIKAIDTCSYTNKEIERVVKTAFELASNRRRKVTSIDKANVLQTSRLWRETVIKVSQEYQNIELEHLYVDNAAMQILKRPTDFDVIVCDNMFGDILSDEAAVLTSSIGLLPSASIGNHHPFLYEPVHGSSPKHAGKNEANPIGAILSAALMLRYSFKLEKEASAIEKAVDKAFNQGARTYDIAKTDHTRRVLAWQVQPVAGVSTLKTDKAVTTSQMGDIIAKSIASG